MGIDADSPHTVHAGTLVARRLRASGIDTVFTLSGGHIFPIYDGCRSAGIRLIDTRHEQTAAFAAEGWSKVTRVPGVVALTAGPGVTNGMSAMAAAQQNQSPMLVLAGRAPALRWGMGSLQEIDHVPFVRPLTKLAATAGSTDEIPGLVDDALATAMRPHSGPAFLDFPLDHVFMEAEEPFREGQTGSSAMPHKRNPIICERVCGLARVIRGNAGVALQDVALWHERDISHSSAERVILPDSTILLDYITHKFIEVLEGLVVYPLKMEEDIAITQGLIFSEKVLLSLVSKGVTRLYAYKTVQASAMKAARGEGSFYENLLSDPDVADVLTPAEIADCFDTRKSLTRIGVIFDRLEAMKVEP